MSIPADEASLVELVREEFSPVMAESQRKAAETDRLVRSTALWQPDSSKGMINSLSKASLMGLVVEYAAQQLVPEGVSDETGDRADMFEPLEYSGIPSKFLAFHEAILSYGEAFALVLPAEFGQLGVPIVRLFSPKSFGAQFEDLAWDEHPSWAWRQTTTRGGRERWLLWDENYQYELEESDGVLRLVQVRFHGAGVTPVLRFALSDLEGDAQGQPGRFQTDLLRFHKTTNDRLRIQHYNSWRTKYVRNLAEDLSQEKRDEVKLKLEQDDILLGFEEAEFGTLDQTDLTPMVAAQDSDRDTLAAVTQTPVWAFNGGSMVNLSADALIEAKSGNRQKIGSIQTQLNRPYLSTLRLAARLEGRVKDAENYGLRLKWADINSLSLSSVVDALGKAVTQLGIPPQEVWEMIPGVNLQRVRTWRKLAGVPEVESFQVEVPGDQPEG